MLSLIGDATHGRKKLLTRLAIICDDMAPKKWWRQVFWCQITTIYDDYSQLALITQIFINGNYLRRLLIIDIVNSLFHSIFAKKKKKKRRSYLEVPKNYLWRNREKVIANSNFFKFWLKKAVKSGGSPKLFATTLWICHHK